MPQVLIKAVGGAERGVGLPGDALRPGPNPVALPEHPRVGGGHGAFVTQTLDATTLNYLRWSAVALVVLALVGISVSYWLAGRALRPVQLAFDRERRLVANMAHELRTPLATQRTVLEMALDDSAPGHGDELVQAGHEALAQNFRADRIIQAMLTLAQANHADGAADQLATVDLTALVQVGLAERQALLQQADLAARVHLDQAEVTGHATLLAALVGNLLHNA